MKHLSKMMVIKALLSAALLTPIVTNVFAAKDAVVATVDYTQLSRGLTAAVEHLTVANFEQTMKTLEQTWFGGVTPRTQVARVKTNVAAFVAAVIVKVQEWVTAGQTLNAYSIDLNLWRLVQNVGRSIDPDGTTDTAWTAEQTRLVTEFKEALLAPKAPPAATPGAKKPRNPKAIAAEQEQAAIKAATAVIIQPLVDATATDVTVEGTQEACEATKQAIVTRLLSGQKPVITGHDIFVGLAPLLDKIPAEVLEEYNGVLEFANEVLSSKALTRPDKAMTSAEYLASLKEAKTKAEAVEQKSAWHVLHNRARAKAISKAQTALEKAARIMLDSGIITVDSEQKEWEAAAATPKKADVVATTPAAATPAKMDVPSKAAELIARAEVKTGDAL